MKKHGIAAALGTFDGLHMGHMALLKTLIDNSCGRDTMVYTFRNLPSQYFGSDAKLLFTPDEKAEMIKASGIDIVYMQNFTDEIANLSPAQFVRDLVDKLGVTLIVAGEDYTFGKGASTVSELVTETAKLGVRTIVVPLVNYMGNPISSTAIRCFVETGKVRKAAELIGRPYFCNGTVVKGRQLGRTIGFPTANISVSDAKAMPSNGVYATLTEIDGKTYESMTNIGVRPTVDESGIISTETYINGFDSDIYGKKMKVQFIDKIRDEKKMSGIEELKEQLKADLELSLKIDGEYRKNDKKSMQQ